MYRATLSFTTKNYDIRKNQIIDNNLIEEIGMTEAEINEYLEIGYIVEYDGTLEITENGIYNVEDYQNADVDVPSEAPTLQERSVTITTNTTEIVEPETGYDALSKVTVITNVPQLDTSDATAVAGDIVKGKTAYVNGIKITGTLDLLPYTELTYIQSTGTQYIDTGFKPNQDTRLVMDIVGSTQLAYWFGVWNTSFYYQEVYALANDRNSIYYGYGNSGGGTGSTINTQDHSIEIDKNIIKIDNATLITTPTYTFQLDYPIFLCCQNRQGTASWGDMGGSGQQFKIKKCEIYDNGTLVRQFIPVKRKSDFEICLFDTVSQSFYVNAGTGNFVAGEEI